MNGRRISKPALVVCLLMLSALLLAGCSGQEAAPDLKRAYELMAGTGHLPPMIALDADEALNLIGIKTGQMAQSVVMLSQDSLLADEVILLEARDKQGADSAFQLLEGRLKSKADEARTYSPEQYAIINRGILKQEGRVLLLLVSPQADDLYAVYKGLK